MSLKSITTKRSSSSGHLLNPQSHATIEPDSPSHSKGQYQFLLLHENTPPHWLGNTNYLEKLIRNISKQSPEEFLELTQKLEQKELTNQRGDSTGNFPQHREGDTSNGSTISTHPNDHKKTPSTSYNPTDINFTMKTFQWNHKSMVLAKNAMRYDPNLLKLKQQLVPHQLTEVRFWRSYFFQAHQVKHNTNARMKSHLSNLDSMISFWSERAKDSHYHYDSAIVNELHKAKKHVEFCAKVSSGETDGNQDGGKGVTNRKRDSAARERDRQRRRQLYQQKPKVYTSHNRIERNTGLGDTGKRKRVRTVGGRSAVGSGMRKSASYDPYRTSTTTFAELRGGQKASGMSTTHSNAWGVIKTNPKLSPLLKESAVGEHSTGRRELSQRTRTKRLPSLGTTRRRMSSTVPTGNEL